MRRLVTLAVVLALAYAGRHSLVHVLTRTTGTWVGTPDLTPR